jgi:hypothetical protein
MPHIWYGESASGKLMYNLTELASGCCAISHKISLILILMALKISCSGIREVGVPDIPQAGTVFVDDAGGRDDNISLHEVARSIATLNGMVGGASIVNDA